MSARCQSLCSALARAINAALDGGLTLAEARGALAFTAGDLLERNLRKLSPGAWQNSRSDARALAASEFGMLVFDAMKFRAENPDPATSASAAAPDRDVTGARSEMAKTEIDAEAFARAAQNHALRRT